jgi:hypothetical protein
LGERQNWQKSADHHQRAERDFAGFHKKPLQSVGRTKMAFS